VEQALERRTASLEPASGTDGVLVAYLATLESPHSRRAYARHLEAFRAFCRLSSWRELSPAHLVAYRATLVDDGRSAASHNQALAAVRSFLAWAGLVAVAHGLGGDLVRATLKSRRSRVEKPYAVLVERELAELLEAAADSPRDRALLAVLVGAGLRRSEAAAVAVEDLVEDSEGGGVLRVRQGKGRKDRIVPLRPEIVRAVRAYLEVTGRRLGDRGALFLAEDRGAAARGPQALSPRAVGLIVGRRVGAAGIHAKAISPHSLRHTFAIRYLRATGNLMALRSLLGHASVATTQLYADHLEREEIARGLPGLPGLA
jgi:site-specific recombinase XerD